ncbi:hypothetical protein O3G_MSEX009952 [Manduca sexta]|uniref:Protein Skeletor n=1 Tax=Manduca sexta TaxID=7130 RepID=A0A922CSS9_MANSE|nr:hypothetical protein O3G_MSEX009952 [Manduca sexta]
MAGRVPPSRGVAPHVGVALLLLLAVAPPLISRTKEGAISALLRNAILDLISLVLWDIVIQREVEIGGSASSRRPEPYYGRLIGRLNQYAHGIKGTVYAVDESTVFIRGFAYDGTGPDAYFWVGDTPQPTPEGILVPYPEDYDTSKDPPILLAHSNSDILLRLPAGKRLRDIKWLSVWCRRFTRLAHGLRSGNISVLDAKTFYIPNLHYDGAGPDAYFWVPNEVGSLNPLRGYQGEDIEIQLPGKLTAYDIDWLAVWCVEYRHNFGHVYIPKDLDVPPALGQTKITTSSTTSQTPYTTTNNCKEILDKRLQVRWEVQGDQVQITLSARLRKDQYMSFGISGAEGRPAMLGADVVVAYWDSKGNQPKASDYTITHLAQCDGERGVLSGSQKNGITTITYRRPLAAKESSKDKEILTSRSQSVIAAFGPLNSKLEANAHSFMDTTRHDVQLDFGATNDNTCIGLAELDERGPQPWAPRVLSGLTNFTARIGPAGGKRGYTPVTGHPSWGIAWYINDQLIPEIYVERGKTYTFFVEGGDDRTNPAKYHPFYISDSSEGGFGQKKEEDQRKQRVFAGVAYDNEGYPYPTAVGRYCEWTHKTVDQWAKAETFEEYMQTLQLECNNGEPAALNWTVAHETPDLVYYQCYTHNNLGWKIHVVDPGTAVPMPGDQKARMNTATTFPPFKMQENPAQEEQPSKTMEKPKEPKPQTPVLPPAKPADKTPPAPTPAAPVLTPSPWLTMPSFTKTPPNDLYRRLLPAVLFVLTFVTVMTILLIYMDTVVWIGTFYFGITCGDVEYQMMYHKLVAVATTKCRGVCAAVGAQQFRLNMTRDYELARIGQASAALVAYVRQLHLAPRAPPRDPPPAEPTPQVRVLDALYGEIVSVAFSLFRLSDRVAACNTVWCVQYNATFVEFLPAGARAPSTLYLEAARGWDGAVVRAAPRDYLALRGAARALHACLSAADHPREVMYQEGDAAGPFRSRVLCLPLYTVLLAAAATRARLLLLGGPAALPALTHLPFGDGDLHLQNIEILFTDPVVRNKTTEFLLSKNYTVAATFDKSVMYALKEDLNLN